MSPVRMVGVLVALLASVQTACIFGDPEPIPGVLIENRTDLQLKVFSVVPDRPRRLVARVLPHQSREAAGGPCVGEEQLVAETSDGTIIARHGPFDECNEEPWIIETGG